MSADTSACIACDGWCDECVDEGIKCTKCKANAIHDGANFTCECDKAGGYIRVGD